jgi:hypothetical protein
MSRRVKELGGLGGRLTIFNSSPSASARISLSLSLPNARNERTGERVLTARLDTMNVVIVALCHSRYGYARERAPFGEPCVFPDAANQYSITR